jgi:ABC-type polysaccharide/polyol phosphate export permease
LTRNPTSDIWSSVKAFRVWHLLAMQDIRQRYRRSVLGPFWITLSTLVSIIALALVYTRIFKIPAEQYLPFLTLGVVVWGLLSSLLLEACSVFITAESIIKQVSLPFGVHVARMVWRNFIVFFHNLTVGVLILVYMRTPVTVGIVTVPFALALIALAGTAAGYLLGAVCTRFRDIPQVLNSVIQVLFYVTPVIWTPAMLKGHEEFLILNPLYHYLEIVRAPLLGEPVPVGSWATTLACTAVLILSAHLFLRRYRHRIAFWL